MINGQKKQLTISVLVTSKEFENVYPGVECDEMDLHQFTEGIAQCIREDLDGRKVKVHRTVDVEDLEDSTIAELKAELLTHQFVIAKDRQPVDGKLKIVAWVVRQMPVYTLARYVCNQWSDGLTEITHWKDLPTLPPEKESE